MHTSCCRSSPTDWMHKLSQNIPDRKIGKRFSHIVASLSGARYSRSILSGVWEDYSLKPGVSLMLDLKHFRLID